MRPAWFAIFVTFNIGCKTLVCEGQFCFAVIFIEVKNQSSVGPFFFIGIPWHVAVYDQPNNTLTWDQFCYRKIEERISTHLYGKLIVLFFGAPRKGYSPPLGNIADLFKRLACADLCRDTATEIALFHFVYFY